MNELVYKQYDEIIEKLANGTLFGEKIEDDFMQIVVAAYYMGTKEQLGSVLGTTKLILKDK